MALAVGYTATDWKTRPSFQEYVQLLQGWTVEAIEADGRVIGAIYSKDGEMHVSVLKPWRKRWANKRIVEQIKQRMERTTITPGHEQYMGPILERLGFKEANGEYRRA